MLVIENNLQYYWNHISDEGESTLPTSVSE